MKVSTADDRGVATDTVKVRYLTSEGELVVTNLTEVAPGRVAYGLPV